MYPSKKMSTHSPIDQRRSPTGFLGAWEHMVGPRGVPPSSRRPSCQRLYRPSPSGSAADAVSSLSNGNPDPRRRPYAATNACTMTRRSLDVARPSGHAVVAWWRRRLPRQRISANPARAERAWRSPERGLSSAPVCRAPHAAPEPDDRPTLVETPIATAVPGFSPTQD